MNMLASFTRALAATSLQSDARRAALLLHALNAPDRAWALDNLAPPQRELLSSLLDELRQFGLPADQSLVDEAIRSVSANADGSSCMGQPSNVDIEQANARVLASVLASEPPALIARLLRMRAWCWSDALLSELGPMQQVRVREVLADAKLDANRAATRLDLQLVAHLQRRLAQATRSDAAPRSTDVAKAPLRRGSSWFRALRRRLA